MTNSNRLDASLKRLAVALDRLEAAAERRVIAERLRLDQEEALAVMQDDRSRLAVDLDGALARAHALREANIEATRLMQSAGATIRALLEECGPGERN